MISYFISKEAKNFRHRVLKNLYLKKQNILKGV